MKLRSLSLFVCSLALAASGRCGDTGRPNILLIVADDIGYSDVGAFGSEISTPNIDRLSKEGVMLTQFHVAPNCGPTRGSLMTGVDPHLAGMGANHGAATDNQKGKPGYEGHLRDDVYSVGELLQSAGYRTCMTGKWHLGGGENDPASRGFQKTFALLNGAASHYADQAPIVPGSATRYTRNGRVVEELPADFYSSDAHTDELISSIGSGDGDGDEAPFFAFLSFTAAHNPLHAPREFIEKYRGRFDGGWDKLADQRLARMQELGLIARSEEVQARPEWIMAWDELSREQKASRARDMEIYAAMIDHMDGCIGRLMTHLRSTGVYDDTLIVFISDNGPSKTSIMDYLALGGKSEEFFSSFDNSLGNKGLPGSSTDIGPGWAYAAATPFRLFKGYVAQGGIQVPAIVKLPGEMENAGGKEHAFTHVMDLMPTFLAVSGAEYPASRKGKPSPALQGRSLLPLFEGEAMESRGIGWSVYGMDAFRQDSWKVLRMPEPYGNGNWQLYDLSTDPGERRDLSSKFPERTKELAGEWEAYAKNNGVIHPKPAAFYAKPVLGRKY
ncbi:MAG: arylsulfatase [Verrucomicrobiales bacterium]